MAYRARGAWSTKFHHAVGNGFGSMPDNSPLFGPRPGVGTLWSASATHGDARDRAGRRNMAMLDKNCAPHPNIAIEEAALWPTMCRLGIRSLEVGLNAFRTKAIEPATSGLYERRSVIDEYVFYVSTDGARLNGQFSLHSRRRIGTGARQVGVDRGQLFDSRHRRRISTFDRSRHSPPLNCAIRASCCRMRVCLRSIFHDPRLKRVELALAPQPKQFALQTDGERTTTQRRV